MRLLDLADVFNDKIPCRPRIQRVSRLSLFEFLIRILKPKDSESERSTRLST